MKERDEISFMGGDGERVEKVIVLNNFDILANSFIYMFFMLRICLCVDSCER